MGGFIRDLELGYKNKVLILHQKIEGDVNCVVWDAAIVLAKYLEKRHSENEFLKDLNVIELGAGVGCVGITAACLGANVIATDLQENLPFLKFNIDQNSFLWKNEGSATAVPLIWGQTLPAVPFVPDLILLADCIYYEESIEALVKTLKELSSNKTTVLISQEIRESSKQKNCWETFLDKIKEYFTVNFVPIFEQNKEFISDDIKVLELKKK